MGGAKRACFVSEESSEMIRSKVLFPFIMLGLIAFVFLSGCGVLGEDGTSYMALDWVYAPQQLYFPAMPPFGQVGVHYQHPDGTYYGEYVAWDGSYYSFYYTVEVNEGEYGVMLLPGPDGMDRYYTMYLYSWGPELYYVDQSKSFTPTGIESGSLERARADQLGLEPSRSAEVGNQRTTLDESDYDLDDPQEYLFESQGPGYSLRIEGRRYPPK
jgi:hypothetical protein